MKKHHVLIFILLLAIAGIGVWLWQGKASAPIIDKISDTISGDSFNKQAHSINDPASIWIVVNKKRPLEPKTYAPNDLVVPNMSLRSDITNDEKLLRQEAATALEGLNAAGVRDGMKFTMESGYRSYDLQVALYNRYVREQGKTVADTQSARPGYSEHQTGLAVDLSSKDHPECDVEACFGQTPEGKWLVSHAAEYGFIIRYTQGNERITGYIAEPWHLRYVGKSLAQEMTKEHIATMEQFFGLNDASDY